MGFRNQFGAGSGDEEVDQPLEEIIEQTVQASLADVGGEDWAVTKKKERKKPEPAPVVEATEPVPPEDDWSAPTIENVVVNEQKEEAPVEQADEANAQVES